MFEPKLEVREPKETFAKNVNFWVRPSTISRLDTICGVSHIQRSEVLRLLVDFFVNDLALQEKVLRGVKNG